MGREPYLCRGRCGHGALPVQREVWSGVGREPYLCRGRCGQGALPV